MRVFIGVDPRDAVSFNVLQWSIIRRTSRPVSICPLVLPQLPITRRGLTDFTFTRYLVPKLCGYQGTALFLDSDMLCLGDIAEVFAHDFRGSALAVVKNRERFEWPSMMYFNNAECRGLTLDYVSDPRSSPQSLEWADEISELPAEWNHCVGYDEPRDDAKLVHYTMGTPGFKERAWCEYAREWFEERDSMNSQGSILSIHGKGVHMPKILAELEQRMR